MVATTEITLDKMSEASRAIQSSVDAMKKRLQAEKEYNRELDQENQLLIDAVAEYQETLRTMVGQKRKAEKECEATIGNLNELTESYNALKEKYHAKRLKAKRTEYDLIDDYNLLTDQYNTLVEQCNDSDYEEEEEESDDSDSDSDSE